MNDKDLQDVTEHLMTMCYEEDEMVYGIVVDTRQEGFIHPRETPTNSLVEYIEYMENVSPGVKCKPWKLTLEEYREMTITTHLN